MGGRCAGRRERRGHFVACMVLAAGGQRAFTPYLKLDLGGVPVAVLGLAAVPHPATA